jgi:putative ubiquitin-RnfH superfamily antitoxin RatB of RatAB toxin-antitoxin module
MISVVLVTNDGEGVNRTLDVREGTTVGSFVEMNTDLDLDDFNIKVRSEGESSRTVDRDEELEDGDRVSLTPKKVDGAAGY